MIMQTQTTADWERIKLIKRISIIESNEREYKTDFNTITKEVTWSLFHQSMATTFYLK